jgi:prolyl-tRNA synthetase
VPVRVELGPKDLAKNQVCVKMRVDTAAGSGKEFVPEADFIAGVRGRLETYQTELYELAKKRLHERTITLDRWDEFVDTFAGEKSTFSFCHWDGTAETEEAIKAETKATIRCIPLPGYGPEPEPGACIKTGRPSKQRVLFAKAY